MNTIEHSAWVAEATLRFGEDPMGWKFVCPACKHVASLKDWKDAGAPVGQWAYSCIGRSLPGSREALGSGTGPCNYSGGGLFRLNPVHVLHEGVVTSVFAFAEWKEEGR